MTMGCVVVSFDFDGTLVLSNRIKRDGFINLASEYPGGVDLMLSILARPDARNRVSIFRHFCEHRGLNDPLLPGALAARYGDWCEEMIVAAPSRRGADLLLDQLKRAAIPIYVCSATPQDALIRIIRRRYGTDFFTGVYGDPCPKHEAFRQILELQGCEPSLLLHVGDSRDDQHAAAAAGCQFLPVAGHGLDHDGGLPCLEDLQDVSGHVALPGLDA
jgi:phosphoglycolate phosphatase